MKIAFYRVSILAVCMIGLAACGNNGSAGTSSGQKLGPPSVNPQALQAAAAKAAVAALPKPDPSVPLSQYSEITGVGQLGELYTAFAALPVDYDNLAQRLSKDYQSTNDQFKKHDILSALRPTIDAQIAAFKAAPYVYYRGNASLNHYDFNTQSFPVTGLPSDSSERVYFNYDQYYTLSIVNGSDFSHYKVTDEQAAKKIESWLAGYNNVAYAKEYLFCFGVDLNTRAVKAQIVKIELFDRGNNLVGSF